MGDDGSDSGVSDLISSLASNATSAYETTEALNANPLNTAIVYGGTASTAQGTAGGATSVALGGLSGTAIFLIIAAVVAIFVIAK